jgi:ribonuclease Z
LRITILGSSSATPVYDRYPSSQLLTVNDHHYLIDCGEGTLFRLNTFKIKKNKILAIFISHLHGDHFYGLIGLLSTMSMQERTEKLTILSPAKLKNVIDLQCEVSKTQLRFPIEYIEFDDSESSEIFRDQNVKVDKIPLYHKITTCGFLFTKMHAEYKINKEKISDYHLSNEEVKSIVHGENIVKNGMPLSLHDISEKIWDEKKYAYISDTEYNENYIAPLHGINLLYHESTFIEIDRERAIKTRHSTAQDAARIAKQADVHKLIIGHFSARYTDLNPLLEEAKTIFANTELAIEGSVFTIEMH